jgi:hypothetical protein
MKQTIVYSILTLFFLIIGFLTRYSLQQRMNEEVSYQTHVAEERKEAEAAVQELTDRIKTATSSETWEALLKDQVPQLVKAVGIEEQTRIKNMLLAKLAESYIEQMEKKIDSARQFFVYDRDHPEARKYMKEALALAAKTEDIVAVLPETFDDPTLTAQWLYRFVVFTIERAVFTTKPNVKSSAPGLMPDTGRIEDLVELARNKLIKILTYAPKNRDAQTALELLEQKQKEMERSGTPRDSDQQQRVMYKMLPQRPGQRFQMTDVVGRSH